jgi:hypothetical protein
VSEGKTHYVGDLCPPDGHRSDPFAPAMLNREEERDAEDE